jgi:hypothetical protein
LFISGLTMAVGGLVVFTIAQERISIWHKAHPPEPLPPLSGFDRLIGPPARAW